MERWLLFGLVLSLVSLDIICKQEAQNRGPGKMKHCSPGQHQRRGSGPGRNQSPRHYRNLESGHDQNGNFLTDQSQDQKQGTGNNQIRNPDQDGQQRSSQDQHWEKNLDNKQDPNQRLSQKPERKPKQNRRDSRRGPKHSPDSAVNQDQDVVQDHSRDSQNDLSLGTDVDQSLGTDEDLSPGTDDDLSLGTDEDLSLGTDEDLSLGTDEDLSPGTDDDLSLGTDEDLSLGTDEDLSLGTDEDLSLGTDEDLSLGTDEDLSLGTDEDLSLGKDEDLSLGTDEDLSLGTDEDLSPGTDEDLSPGTDEDLSLGTDEDLSLGTDEDLSLGTDDVLSLGTYDHQSPYTAKDLSDVDRNDLKHCGKKKNGGVSDAMDCLENVNKILKNAKTRRQDTIEAMKSLEQTLEETEVNETISMSADNLVALLYKPKGPFAGLDIYASENEATSEETVANSKVIVHLPREIDVGSNNTVVFCMLSWPKTNESSDVLYEDRLVSISVRGKNISGLQERVNITINLGVGINETQTPSCRFLDFSTQNFSEEGCQTVWKPGQGEVTCSCDHLTYFGVLLVSADIPPEHLEILSYITLIGCSLSLFVLVVTVLLFLCKRKVRADVSMKVHINLAISLILLNVHFLPSHTVAALASSGLCFYFALALHYSLLATCSWMALEGFHVYLLLVRVFNIYIRRYLLKLSVVGWGVPVVIVSVVVIIDRDAYGVFPLDSSNPNSTEICYIVNTTVKVVTTVGVFSVVFCFNLAMLGVTIRRVVSLRQRKQHVSGQSGQTDYDRVKQDTCTLLGVTLLLGIPWGLVFFSFGYLTVPGLYAFCILNSLQGFFIFLWFLMSLRKFGNSAAKTSSKTQSTNG